MKPTVVVADDHPVFRLGVRTLLEQNDYEVLGETSNGLDAIQLARQFRPDVMILDMAMPTLNGVSAVSDILRASPRTKIVLLTMSTDEHQILQALRAGVKGCVSKTQTTEHLLHAVRETCAGGVYLSPSVSGIVVQGFLTGTQPPSDRLSGRERQVLQLVAEGKTTKEIASLLGVSVKTAESHRTTLMSKLDMHSAAALVRYAIRNGLVEP
jgi:DNA-binding NarL/FixJ family response regulator